jgi:tetratricopeptide (TPR) repeat protein
LCSFAVQIYDLEALESLPSLLPFRSLSPALEVVSDVVEMSKCFICGRHEQHTELARRVLERIALPDHGGLDAAQHRRTWLGVHYVLALMEASLGSSNAEKRIELLEDDREYRVIAWRLRMVMFRSQGNIEEARRCERRAELLQLQERSEQVYLGSSLPGEVMVYADTGDVVGVKSGLTALTRLAERHPRWRSVLTYGQARFRALQGDLDGALDLLLPALEFTPVGRHNAWVWLAGAHVRLLAELGRNEEAVREGRKYLELVRREALAGGERSIWIGLTHALAATGEFDEAIRTIQEVIETTQQLGSVGFALGFLYETRARVAIMMKDRGGFDHYVDLCAAEYKKAKNPALAARVARLIEEASQREVAAGESSADVQDLLQSPAVDHTEYNTVHSRMFECVDGGDRARCALTLLLQSTESAFGLLYGVHGVGRRELAYGAERGGGSRGRSRRGHALGGDPRLRRLRRAAARSRIHEPRHWRARRNRGGTRDRYHDRDTHVAAASAVARARARVARARRRERWAAERRLIQRRSPAERPVARVQPCEGRGLDSAVLGISLTTLSGARDFAQDRRRRPRASRSAPKTMA